VSSDCWNSLGIRCSLTSCHSALGGIWAVRCLQPTMASFSRSGVTLGPRLSWVRMVRLQAGVLGGLSVCRGAGSTSSRLFSGNASIVRPGLGGGARETGLLSMNEKDTMQNLNDRLAAYLEMVSVRDLRGNIPNEGPAENGAPWFESELAIRRGGESDISALRKVLDELTLSKASLEEELESLQEELAQLQKNHGEVQSL
uniref:IF rod domain-containing protein n=1 Tax=Chelonoidis abingdonii TaxID=106734 RepID=A0A8C0IS92_CHEAB